MALSEQEQKMLDELERGLYASDANLAHKLGKPGSFSPRRIVSGLAIAVIGISLLVVAVMIQLAIFGVVGFLVMLAGLALASGAKTPGTPKPSTTSQTSKPKAPKGSFFEDRWDKRQGL